MNNRTPDNRIPNNHVPNRADTDAEMHAFLQVDPVPEHSADFWNGLDAELDAAPSAIPLRPRRSLPQNFGPMLVAAALLVAVVAGGAYRFLTSPSEMITTTVPSPQTDGAETPGTDAVDERGQELPAPTDDVVDATIAAPTPDLLSTPTAAPLVPATLTPVPPSTPSPTDPVRGLVPPLTDGSWIIAPGDALGVTPDGSAAWVRTISAVGGIGCEGFARQAIWRVPFDGGTPSMMDADVDLADAFVVAVDGNRAAIVEACDGIINSVVLVDVSPEGMMSGGDRVMIEGLDPIADIHDVSWQDDGSLLLVAADGISVATAVHERNGELRSRAVDPGTAEFRLPDLRAAALAGPGWTLESRDGFVHATPSAGDVFFGQPVAVAPTGFDLPAPVNPYLMNDDLSGWFGTLPSPDSCQETLVFVDFNTAIPFIVEGDAKGRINAIERSGDQVISSGFCEGVEFTQTFLIDELQAMFSLPPENAPVERPTGTGIEVPVGDAPFTNPGALRNERFDFIFVPPPAPWEEVLPRVTNGDGYTFVNGVETIRVFGTHDVEGQFRTWGVLSSSQIPRTFNYPDGTSVDASEVRLNSPSSNIPGGYYTQVGFFMDGSVVVVQADTTSQNDPAFESIVSGLLVGAPTG